jgi:Na+/glutamate symporter
MNARWIRAVYVAEFFLALAATFVSWREVVGVSYWEVIPSGWRLGLTAGVAITAVFLTWSLVEHEQVLNRRAVVSLVAGLALAAVMAMVSNHYVSLEQELEEGEAEEQQAVLRI